MTGGCRRVWVVDPRVEAQRIPPADHLDVVHEDPGGIASCLRDAVPVSPSPPEVSGRNRRSGGPGPAEFRAVSAGVVAHGVDFPVLQDGDLEKADRVVKHRVASDREALRNGQGITISDAAALTRRFDSCRLPAAVDGSVGRGELRRLADERVRPLEALSLAFFPVMS